MAKKKILLEIEVSDEYLEEWKEDLRRYYFGKPDDVIEKLIAENPYEKSIADSLENYVPDILDSVQSCKATVVD